jgi:hypothetical protein
VDDDELDFGTYPATVVDVRDEKGLHRVKFTIPGKIARSDWALPTTIGGGSAQRGGHVVPAVGSDIEVRFAHGNKNFPLYSCGWWGTPRTGSEMPRDIIDAKNEAHLVQAFEIGNLGTISFRVTLDERPTKRSFRIYAVDTTTNTQIAGIELDLEQRGLVLHGLTGVAIQSDGFVQLTAPTVQFNGRTLQTKAGPV